MNEKTMSKGVGIVLIAGLMSLVLGSSLLPTPPANAADVLLVSVAIIASPDTICVGQSTNISWSSFDATSVSINQGIGSVTNFGSQSVSPTQTTTYTITGTNPTGGYGAASATVYVTGPCSTPTPTPTWTPTPTPTWTPTPTPFPNLGCTPSVQSAVSGEWVTFSATYPYPTFWAGNLTWSAVGGSPSTGTGSSFGTRFYTSSISETRVVTVNDGHNTASCLVYVYGPQPTWTPTPTPTPMLQCSPSYVNANSGERVYLSAWGGNGSYTWRANGGSPDSGNGSSFSTRFYTNGNSTQSVSVRSGNQTAYCTVYVYGQPTWTPTPTPSYNWFSMSHTLRNLTHSDSGTSVTARNGDRIQFITNITTGDQYAEDVHVRDWLPQYVSYTYGSTTVDGASYQDGIATGNNGDSLALGNLRPNRTYVVRFEGTVNGAPNVTLTNSVNVHVRGLVDQSRTSTIRVTGSHATPTPTWTPTPAPSYSTLTLSLTGLNRTRGQSTEATSVRARGNDTVEFFLRVRNSSNGYLTNVIVTDYLPAGLNYAAGTTTLNGYAVGDGVTSSGISVGSLASGQTATVKFSVTADAGSVPAWGEVVVIDRAQARADNAATVAAQMNVVLGKNLTVASVSSVQTGPVDSILLSLIVAALATGGYAMYTRSNSFGRSMSLAEIRTAAGRSMNFSR